jgi:transposase InsO family protein
LLFDLSRFDLERNAAIGFQVIHPAQAVFEMGREIWPDLYSRKIVDRQMAEAMISNLVVEALAQAIRREWTTPGLIVRSDRGAQCVATEFRALLKRV